MTLISDAQIEQLDTALSFISRILGSRFRPMLRSQRRPDQYEALTAVIYLMSSAASPHFVSRESRLRSFIDWWPAGGQSAEDMAESGFYHTGEADHVKCFFCDLGLRDWANGDQPETEHAKFSPLCFFLKSSRGLEWLRGNSPRPPNYPASYLRQDHNELIRLLHEELQSRNARIACAIGFHDTTVLLCIARKFIRFRQKFDLQSLVTELQAEFDREIQPAKDQRPMFVDRFNLSGILVSFNPGSN